MRGKTKNVGYPVFEGLALLRVRLGDCRASDMDRIYSVKDKARLFFLRSLFNGYFAGGYRIPAPWVRLNPKLESAVEKSADYEYNLFRDEMPFFHKLRLNLGRIATAGFLLSSAVGLLAENVTPSAGTVVSREESANSGMAGNWVIQSHEDFRTALMASVSEPMKKHPFRKIGHTNISVNHRNVSSTGGHLNLGPDNSGHTNASAHSNSHSNYFGHNNSFSHQNSYTDSP